ncbi:MAG: amino acid ABC transporter [Chloroflexota bacterium]|nr:MAG: amino acid ABC transporter [Chloroflexota bacterium]
MKSGIRLLLLALLLTMLSSAAGAAAQDTVLPDLGGRAVTIAVENAYPPFNMLDANGVGVGWDYDSIREICVRLNCTPEFIPASWEGLIVAVSNGEFDVAADGITITAERAELVDFSMGYANIIQRLMVTVDEARFDNADAFIAGDYVLGVQLATTNYLTAVELVGESRIVGFSDFGSAVQALIGGDVDAVIIDDVAGQGYVGENAEQIKLLGDVLRADEQLGYIFPKGSDLVAPFNMALMGMIVDGTLNQINAVWGLGPYFASE